MVVAVGLGEMKLRPSEGRPGMSAEDLTNCC